jgi:hypothetical protein
MSILLDSISIVFEKDFLGGMLSVVSIAISIYGFKLARDHAKNKYKTVASVMDNMEIKITKARREGKSLSENDRKELEVKLAGLEKIIEDYRTGKMEEKTKNKQQGFISQDFMLYAVPAIIALTFTFTLVYLLISNQSNVNYQSPEVLKSGLSTIVGYYFGVAVKESPKEKSSPSEMSPEEFKKQIESIIKN